MYRAATRNIEVTVTPRFMSERSSPENGYFFWAYTIEIINRSDSDGATQDPALEDHRRARPAAGGQRRGRGGRRRRCSKPGQSYEYTSGVPLPTPSGFMVGTYGMVTEEGEGFDIEIPAFSLDSQTAARTLN